MVSSARLKSGIGLVHVALVADALVVKDGRPVFDDLVVHFMELVRSQAGFADQRKELQGVDRLGLAYLLLVEDCRRKGFPKGASRSGLLLLAS